MNLKLLLVIQIFIYLIEMKKEDFKNVSNIIGGNWSDIEKHPFLAAVVIQSRFYCGGTVIAPKHILTAAHCISKCPTDNIVTKIICHSGHPNDYHVITGNTFLIDVDNEDTNVLRVLLHPRYSISRDGCSDVNNLGILYLKNQLLFNQQIQPVTLQQNFLYTKQQRRSITNKIQMEGKECIALGWGIKKRPVGIVSKQGRYLKNEEIFHYLKEAVVTLTPNGVCNEILVQNNSTLICPESNICALHDTSSFCIENAGGPLLCDGIQTAVVSRAVACGKGFSPIVLTPLDKHLEWIRNIYQADIVRDVVLVSSGNIFHLKHILVFVISLQYSNIVW